MKRTMTSPARIGVFSMQDEIRKGDWIQTFTGKAMWPMDPRADEIDIADIAHALSMMCRFNGMCTRFYSVAEHCVHVANAAPHDLKLTALLHDASEAYLADIVRPVKRWLPQYKKIETQLDKEIAYKFGLTYPWPAEVTRLDNGILADEMRQVMATPPRDWNLVEPAGIGARIECWSWQYAGWEFLRVFHDLTG